MEDAYGDFRPSIMVYIAKDGGDILRSEILLELNQIHRLVMNVTATSRVGATKGRIFTYDQLCTKALPVVSCISSSVLSFWNFDDAVIRGDSDIHATVSRNSTIAASLQLTHIGLVLGSIRWNNGSGPARILSAGAARSVYLTKATPDLDPISKEWERGFLEVASREWKHVNVSRWTRVRDSKRFVGP